MKEPFYSAAIGEDQRAVEAERFKNLGLYALSLPKFGQGDERVDKLGQKLMRDIIALARDLIRNPGRGIAEKTESVRQCFGSEERPFEFVITPGVATFEDYGGLGAFLGAPADGRRCFHSVASDCSPAPCLSELPVPGAVRLLPPVSLRARERFSSGGASCRSVAQLASSHVDQSGAARALIEAVSLSATLATHTVREA